AARRRSRQFPPLLRRGAWPRVVGRTGPGEQPLSRSPGGRRCARPGGLSLGHRRATRPRAPRVEGTSRRPAAPAHPWRDGVRLRVPPPRAARLVPCLHADRAALLGPAGHPPGSETARFGALVGEQALERAQLVGIAVEAEVVAPRAR